MCSQTSQEPQPVHSPAFTISMTFSTGTLLRLSQSPVAVRKFNIRFHPLCLPGCPVRSRPGLFRTNHTGAPEPAAPHPQRSIGLSRRVSRLTADGMSGGNTPPRSFAFCLRTPDAGTVPGRSPWCNFSNHSNQGFGHGKGRPETRGLSFEYCAYTVSFASRGASEHISCHSGDR